METQASTPQYLCQKTVVFHTEFSLNEILHGGWEQGRWGISDSYPRNLHNCSVNLESGESEECPLVQISKDVLDFFLIFFTFFLYLFRQML